MGLFVATTRDEANADRVVKILKRAGSTHVHKIHENGAFTVKFTEPSAIEIVLAAQGGARPKGFEQNPSKPAFEFAATHPRAAVRYRP